VRFGSSEWIQAVVAALNAQPELAAALTGLGKTVALVVESDPPVWPRAVAAFAEHDGRRVARCRLLADEDEILELEPNYVIRAPYRVYRQLLGGADPVQAALAGRVRVEGDLEALVRRARYRHVVDAALAAVATELP
jgi:hypothetical protein